MQDYFYTIAGLLSELLQGEEIFTCSFNGEDSHFVRFNRAKLRQIGHVRQQNVSIDLIDGRRHAAADLSLAGNLELDRPRLQQLIAELRALSSHIPQDPHLCYASAVQSGSSVQADELPSANAMIEEILLAAEGFDLVGILASGSVYVGFANSFGQRNWHQRASFNFDWSLYGMEQHAVKARYAGLRWDSTLLRRRMQQAAAQLQLLQGPARKIAPGAYRVYLAPAALEEIMGLLAWGGFGLRAHRTKTTPLLRMPEQGVKLDARVTLRDEAASGIAPGFNSAGFLCPPQISLIEQGRYRDCLASPRSAAEYGVPCNGAGGDEAPQALTMDAGQLAQEQVLTELDTGLYIGNLWYLNYSDRNECRITGMTRFACFQVEHARIRAPIEAMRFDDSLFRMFGEGLLGLTRERELLLDPGTYSARSLHSALLPGALIDGMRFTL